MAMLPLTFSLFALVVAAALNLSCGGGTGSPRYLQSVSMTPTTAAQDYPNSQVQFTLTGYYNAAPTTVTPQSATWGACLQGAPTTEVSVTTFGLAQCASGSPGTYTIWANDPIQAPGTYACPAFTACGGGCTLQATAQLTCP